MLESNRLKEQIAILSNERSVSWLQETCLREMAILLNV